MRGVVSRDFEHQIFRGFFRLFRVFFRSNRMIIHGRGE